ncbi:MAG: hypothetical protein QM766_15325 [Burkholderiaceae bacterium]
MSVLAFALTALASACFYLSSPNQRWLVEPLPTLPLMTAGLALLATGIWLWMAALRPLAGVCAALHGVMVCLFAFPYLTALRAARRQG